MRGPSAAGDTTGIAAVAAAVSPARTTRSGKWPGRDARVAVSSSPDVFLTFGPPGPYAAPFLMRYPIAVTGLSTNMR